MPRRPAGRHACDPFARNRLEALGILLLGGALSRLLTLAWIYAVGDQRSGLERALPRLLEVDFRVHAERDALLLAGEVVLQAPPLAAGGGDLEVQAISIVEAQRSFGGLRVADREIGEHLGATPWDELPQCLCACPQSCPQMRPTVNRQRWTSSDQRLSKFPVNSRVSRAEMD